MHQKNHKKNMPFSEEKLQKNSRYSIIIIINEND